jgi:nucleoside-diphosphate kinase
MISTLIRRPALVFGQRRPYCPQPQQHTLVIIKAEAVRRGLTGEILHRFLRKGLTLVNIKMVKPDAAKARLLYQEHEHKPFFGSMVDHFTRGPMVAVLLKGEEAIPAVRHLIGETNTLKAQPGSIRGDYALGATYNLVHGSDCQKAAAREIPLFFPDTPRLAGDALV